MIKIKDLCKSFNRREVLKRININLPSKGIVAFVGPSGCGKTTLLNCIAGLYKFDGDIVIKNQSIKNFYENQSSVFRLKTIGFVFQDYKLFEGQDIYSNIIFPFESIYDDTSKNKKDKVVDLLKLVGLKKHLNTKVNKLSGGEKQRVAIARSLINDPSIIICDEPTGNLDEKRSFEIMEIFKIVSKTSLVIIVSHNLPLIRKYADTIYHLRDGDVIDKEVIETEEINKGLLYKKNRGRLRRVKIPSKFVSSHVIQKIKQKKYRTFISASMMGLGLMSFGLSLCLSSMIGSNIKAAYTSVIQEDRIIVSKKEKSEFSNELYSATKDDLSFVVKNHQEEVYDYGYIYTYPFEDAFIDTNEFNLFDSFEKYAINGLSIRNINEFKWLDLNKETVYPVSFDNLKNNEVVLGITIDTLMDICYQLRIKRTVESLIAYLAEKSIPIALYVENLNWTYQDVQVFDVVGFILENKNCIYHTNHRWNEYVFEECMRLPTSNNIYGVLDKPWIIRKIPYIQVKKSVDNLLELAILNLDLQKYYFEVGNKNFFPLTYDDIDQKIEDKLMMFLNNLPGILPIYSDYFTKTESSLSKPIFGSNGGYLIYPTLMIMGFANQTYFSNELASLESAVDIVSSYNLSVNENYALPDQVLMGHYSNTAKNNVIFDVFDNNLIFGNAPKTYDDIVVSKEFALNLFGNYEVSNKPLYLAHIVNETQGDNGTIYRTFDYVELNITGVVNDNRMAIFHSSYWPLIYFQKHLGYSRLALDCNYISFEVENIKDIPEIIEKLSGKYENFNFLNPSEEINTGIDEICFYLQIVLAVFSVLTIVISVLLLVISNYLFINENRKEIGLLRCIGLTSSQTSKFIVMHSVLMAVIAFLFGTIYLMMINLVLNSQIASLLNVPFRLNFDLFSLLSMLALAIVVSLFSCLIFNKKFRKIEPLSALRK